MDNPICLECEDDLVKVGSHWVCRRTDCGRYALPCSEVYYDHGYTTEEYDNECERRGEQQAVSDMESGYDVPGVFGGAWRNGR